MGDHDPPVHTAVGSTAYSRAEPALHSSPTGRDHQAGCFGRNGMHHRPRDQLGQSHQGIHAQGCLLGQLDVMDAFLGKECKGTFTSVQQDNGRGNNYGYRVGNWKLQRHDSKETNNYRGQLKSSPTWTCSPLRPVRLEQGHAGKEKRRGTKPGSIQSMTEELQKIIDDGRSR